MQIDVQEFLNDLPHLDSNSNYWLVRANGGDYFTDFNLNSYIGIGWNKITLDDIQESNNSNEQLKTIILDKYPNIVSNTEVSEVLLDEDDSDEELDMPTYEVGQLTTRQLSSTVGQLLRFTNDMNINDLVVVPSANSEQFIVGKITSTPFEETKKHLDTLASESTNYKQSNFLKRIKVNWLGRFGREDADTALYKMIYSQHAISNIDSYSPYINRAIFDAYVLDGDELHLTYHVTQETNIEAKLLGQFIYQYSEMYELLSESNDLKIKVNIQSKGPAESTAKYLIGGAATFIMLFCAGSAAYGGGKVSYSKDNKIDIEMNGIAKQHRENLAAAETVEAKAVSDQLKAEDQEAKSLIEREEEAYKTAKKLQVPISSLGIDMPHKAEVALQKQLDRETKKAHQQTDEPN